MVYQEQEFALAVRVPALYYLGSMSMFGIDRQPGRYCVLESVDRIDRNGKPG